MKSKLSQLPASMLVLYLCQVAFSPAAAPAQVISCDLQSCIAMAMTTHPMLKVSQAQQAAARSEVAVKQGVLSPTLDLEGEMGYLTGQSLSPFAAISGVTEEGAPQRPTAGGYYQATVGIDIPLVKEGTLVGRTSAAVQQAHLKVSQADWGMQGLRLQVAANVVETFIEVLKQHRAIAIYGAIAASVEASYQLILARYQQNLISRNDLLVAEVRFATAKKDLAVAYLALQRSQKALALAMGLDHSHDVEAQELQGTPPSLMPVEQLLTRAQETHPELKVQQLKVQASTAEVRRIQSERYPALDLTARYGVVDAFSGRLSDQFQTAVKVKVPLFDFGLIKNKADVARAKIMEEETRLLDAQRHLEGKIYDLYVQAQVLAEQAELLSKQIEQATEAVKLNRALYQQELLPISAVLDAEGALQKLQLALSEAAYGQQSARLRLALLSGTWDLPQPSHHGSADHALLSK